MAVLAALGAASSVLGKGGGLGGGDSKPDGPVSVTTGPVNQSMGGGAMFEATDSYIWLVALAVLAAALFIRK